MQVMDRILLYLKPTPRRGLLFKKGESLSMEICIDADYAVCLVDKRSTSRYYMFLGGNLVTWKSKKQNVVVKSSGYGTRTV